MQIARKLFGWTFWLLGLVSAGLSLSSILVQLLAPNSSTKGDGTSDNFVGLDIIEGWNLLVQGILNAVPEALELVIETNSLAANLLVLCFSLIGIRLMSTQLMKAWIVESEPGLVKHAWRRVFGGDLRSVAEKRTDNIKQVLARDLPLIAVIATCYLAIILVPNFAASQEHANNLKLTFVAIGSIAAGAALKKLIDDSAWKRQMLFVGMSTAVILFFQKAVIPTIRTSGI